MNLAKVVIVTVLAGTLSIAIALFSEHWLAERGADTIGLQQHGKHATALPDLRLADLSGRQVALGEWAGKVVVLNYWATWCPPCLREIPVLAALQAEVGAERLQVIGIAIDRLDAVARFLQQQDVGYPVLLGDADAIEASRRLGNRTSGLPFTAVFDRRGTPVFSHTGEIRRQEIEQHILPLLSRDAG
ncbi:TlpA family protein disulfide reductase [Thiohalocapsa marina]|uniref:TlpA family protein disulfide reductase n=1 Tax=Thiohalocapsa marina TaxID=424902 RepID=UPI0036DD8AD3